MSRKNLVALACATALLAAGCTSLRPPAAETPAPPQKASPAPTSLATPAPKPTPRVAPRPVRQPAPQQTATGTAPTAIRANVVRDGNSLLVSRGPAAAPVPLFRQAIVLANVRAAVAGLSAQPRAEFQRGLLTLTFPRSTGPEVAAAVNRAIEVPEVTRLRIIPPQ